MSEELKPCPFCGGAARFIRPSIGVKDTSMYDTWTAVQCNECGALVGDAGRRFRNREDATKVWNKRPGHSTIRQRGVS